MLTLYHSANSRSSGMITLIDEMGLEGQIAIHPVTIGRIDGSGMRDPANPHPEGKVPVLVHDGEVITERAAIILHLCQLFPQSGLSPVPGTPEWGRFVSWLVWYQGVLEPVLIHQAAGLTHPMLAATFRDHAAAVLRLQQALEAGPWLMGGAYSAADLLVHSPYAWFADFTPDDPLIRDWVARCMARPARARTMARDADWAGQPSA